MGLITNKSLTEVYEVLKHLSKIEYYKIPKEAIDIIVQNKDNNYKWNYDETKSLSEQNLSREAIAILSYINLEYLLNDEKRKLMEEIYEKNEKKLEEKKSKLYNKDDLFIKKSDIENKQAETQKENVALIEEKEKILTKFLKKIKAFFKKRNDN